jgi:hypothetical protein
MHRLIDLKNIGDFSQSLPDVQSLHRSLARWNRRRLAPGPPAEDWGAELLDNTRMMRLELEFVEAFRGRVSPLVERVPTSGEAFVAWFEGLKEMGPGQWDPLFGWLEVEASMEEMKWFLTQEAAGEAGFDDLVALTQVKLPARPKLELARNYWDEMGRGAEAGMHGPMLQRTVEGLSLWPTIETTIWPSLALANTMTAFATQRRYVYHSVGALGVVELTAPARVASIAAGLERLGVPAEQRKYFKLHANLDVEHSRAWNVEAIAPLVEEHPESARYLAEGALMRLLCGECCFDHYRAHLWAGAREAQPYAAE